jgi:hypothetical protein
MLFDSPIPFADALKSRKVKSLLPTELSSGDLAKIDPQILERAKFMARCNSATILQSVMDEIEQGLNPHTEMRDGKPVTIGPDPATMRLNIKKALGNIGYQPDPEDEGTIKDFSSDQRINLVVKTNTEMAQGYGHWMQGQDPDALDQFPCQELFRLEDRQVPRDWLDRWEEAGGELTDDDRMIARKNDPIWTALSAFGDPYPPFDYNSGMWVRDISRDEAEELGVIDPDEQIKGAERGFNDDLKLTPDIRSGALVTALVDAGYNFVKGVLTL